MYEQVCRLEIIQLHLATQHRGNFVTVTLAGSEPLTADDEVANQLRHKPLVGVLRLLHEHLELVRGLGNLREASRPDIKPENSSLSVSQKQISEGADHDQLRFIINQPAPVFQESIALLRIKTDCQLIPSDTHDWWRVMTPNIAPHAERVESVRQGTKTYETVKL